MDMNIKVIIKRVTLIYKINREKGNKNRNLNI